MAIARLFDFIPGTLIKSGEVDSEFNNIIDYINNTLVLKTGDTMTGALVLSGAPTIDLHASTKKYVDDKALTLLDLAATRIMTGDLNLNTHALLNVTTMNAVDFMAHAARHAAAGADPITVDASLIPDDSFTKWYKNFSDGTAPFVVPNGSYGSALTVTIVKTDVSVNDEILVLAVCVLEGASSRLVNQKMIASASPGWIFTNSLDAGEIAGVVNFVSVQNQRAFPFVMMRYLKVNTVGSSDLIIDHQFQADGTGITATSRGMVALLRKRK